MTDQQDDQSGAVAEVEQIDDQDATTLRDELESARERADDYENKYLRARADMENYKKRIERTYADLAKSGKKDLLAKLLAVKDNLERALRFGESSGENGGVIEGVRLTEYQLNQLLEQQGVTPIEAQGQPFNPADQEAVQTVHDPNLPDHTVVQVAREGYMYGDEVLRPAQVVVNVLQDQD